MTSRGARRLAPLICALTLAATACVSPAQGRSISLDPLVRSLIEASDRHYAAAAALVDAAKPRSLDPDFEAWSASSTGRVVTAYAAPTSTAEVVAKYPPVNYFGHDPTTFAVFEEQIDDAGNAWYRAQLPPVDLEAFPNGTEAWIPADGLAVTGHDHELVVDLSEHTLRLYEDGVEQEHWLVGIGKPGARTPTGSFFMWTKWLPSQGSHPAYGVGALAISAQSEDLPSWQGGAPLIALHGTSRTSDLGSDVSHGCVRISNTELQALIDRLALGTPVEIVA